MFLLSKSTLSYRNTFFPYNPKGVVLGEFVLAQLAAVAHKFEREQMPQAAVGEARC